MDRGTMTPRKDGEVMPWSMPLPPMQPTQEDIELTIKAERMLEALRLEKERQAIRDQFAAAALSGMLARPSIDDDPLEFHFLCEHAYKWADAMLEARKVNPPE